MFCRKMSKWTLTWLKLIMLESKACLLTMQPSTKHILYKFCFKFASFRTMNLFSKQVWKHFVIKKFYSIDHLALFIKHFCHQLAACQFQCITIDIDLTTYRLFCDYYLWMDQKDISKFFCFCLNVFLKNIIKMMNLNFFVFLSNGLFDFFPYQ